MLVFERYVKPAGRTGGMMALRVQKGEALKSMANQTLKCSS
jgi:hypothetical protein